MNQLSIRIVGPAERAVVDRRRARDIAWHARLARHGVPVREANAADLPALTKLVAKSIEAAWDEDATPSQREQLLRHRSGVDPDLVGLGRMLVAEIDGEMVGAAAWSARRDEALPRPVADMRPPPHAYLHALHVHPALRGRGIGGRLLETLERRLGTRAYDVLELLAPPAAAGFFWRRGYAPAGDVFLPLPGTAPLRTVHLRKRLAAGRGR